MGLSIKNNISSLNALRHANNNFQKVKGNIERLSSGMKVNKAADGPATLIASERLRGQIVSMRQALQNSETSVTMVQTAEGALNEVSGLLLNLRQLAVHAANEATNDKEMLNADQLEIEHLLESIDRIATNTTYGTRKLLDGSNAANGVAVGDDLLFVEASTLTQPSPESGYAVDIYQVATRAKAKGTIPIDVNNIKEGISLVISEGGKSAVLDTTKGELSDAIKQIVANVERDPEIFNAERESANIRNMLVTQLQKKVDEANLPIDIYIDPNNLLTARHREFGDHTKLSVTGSIDGILSAKANIAQFADPGKNVEGTINGEIALGQGQTLVAAEGTRAEGLTIKYTKELGLKEIHEFDEDGNIVDTKYVEETNDEVVGFPEENRLEGFIHFSQNSVQFQVGPFERQNTALSMGNVRTNQLSRGIENESGFDSLADVDVTTTQGARDAMYLIDSAIQEVSRLRGQLGSFQKNALESNLNSMRIAEENLTQAESNIRDSDMAKEMSELTGGQIMLNSSTAMLAQANQVPNAVLGLVTGNA